MNATRVLAPSLPAVAVAIALALATGSLAATAGGCYSTPQPDCGFVCGPAGECPDDYQCSSENRCVRIGAPANVTCPGPPDAAPPRRDAAVDADLLDAAPDAPPDADVTPPTVASTTPADMATDIARNTTITVVFDEDVTGVSTTSFTVAIGATAVDGAIAQQTPTTYVFTPTNMLMPSSTVTVSLTAAIMDEAGNALVPTSFTFETGTN